MIKQTRRLPTLVGGGVTPLNVNEILDVVDGVIVASSLEVEDVRWKRVEPARVRAFMAGSRR